MKVNDVPAGRTLDALVAEKVMDFYFDDGFWIEPNGAVRLNPFQPSLYIEMAFEAAEHLDLFQNRVLTKNEDGKYIICHPCEAGNWPEYYAGASESAALAICRAALKAVGVTEVPD